MKRRGFWPCFVLVVLAFLASVGSCDSKRSASSPDRDAASGARVDGAAKPISEAGTSEASTRDANTSPPSVDPIDVGEQAWLLDPEIWKKIPESPSPECPVFAGEPDKLKFPRLEWKLDASGYEIADIVQGYGAKSQYIPEAVSVYFPYVETLFEDAQGYLISWSTLGSSKLSIARLIRLDDGVTIAALQDRLLDRDIYCAQQSYRDARVTLSGEARDGSGEPIRLIARAGADGRWTFAYPIKPDSQEPPVLSDDFLNTATGESVGIGLGVATLRPSASSSEWIVIENPSTGDGRTLTAQGDLAVWTDPAADGNVRIRGWAPDGLGVRTLIDFLEHETLRVGLSPTHLLGVAPATPPTIDENGTYDDGYLWAAPRAYALGSPSELRRSPIFKVGQGGVGLLKAWGDYAIALFFPTTSDGGRAGPPFLLVIQLSTWKMWRVAGHTAAGFAIQGHSFTATPKYLYFGERPVPPRDPTIDAGDSGTLTRMLRVTWEDLPKVAEEITP